MNRETMNINTLPLSKLTTLVNHYMINTINHLNK